MTPSASSSSSSRGWPPSTADSSVTWINGSYRDPVPEIRELYVKAS